MDVCSLHLEMAESVVSFLGVLLSPSGQDSLDIRSKLFPFYQKTLEGRGSLLWPVDLPRQPEALHPDHEGRQRES